MMRFFVCFVALIALAHSVSAQQLQIRSGDHPTFSRITIPLPDNQIWEAKRTNEGVELHLPEFTGGFDTSSVFMRMRADRILEIEAQSDRLFFKVNCDCDASTFLADQLLVVDIADSGSVLFGPILEESTAEIPDVSGNMSTKKPMNIVIPWIGSQTPFENTGDSDAAGVVSRPQGEFLEDQEASVLQEIEPALIEQMSTAISSGLLQIDPDVPSNNIDEATESEKKPAIQPMELPTRLAKAQADNVRITTGFDLLDDRAKTVINQINRSRNCPNQSLFAVEMWGGEDDFSSQIALARAALMDARDNLVQSATTNLAQKYLYFGFGAEALEVLAMSDDQSVKQQGLKTIAKVLEYGSDPASPIRTLSHCDTNSALWAVLSFSDIPSGSPINTDAALRALNKLPKHLRSFIAPMLSQRLLMNGSEAEAAMALRSVQRLDGELSADGKLAKQSLQAHTGDLPSLPLEEVVSSNKPAAPQALALLIEAKIAKNKEISQESLLLLDAYSQEYRGTEIAQELQKARVGSLAQNQKFNEAYAALKDISPSISPESSLDLQKLILEKLISNSTNETLIKVVFQHDILSQTASLPPESKLSLASRLLELGFSSEAGQVLRNSPELGEADSSQVMLARLSIDLQQPFQALAQLNEIKSPEANILRAQALAMSGQHRDAFEVYLENGEDEEAMQAAWLADDWQNILPEDTPIFGEVSRLMRENAESTTGETGQIESASKMLSESSSAREVLESLISETNIEASSSTVSP